MFMDTHYDAPILVWNFFSKAFRRFIKEYHTLIGPTELIFQQCVTMTRGVKHFWLWNRVLFHLMLMRAREEVLVYGAVYTEQWILYVCLEGQLEYLAGTPSMICPVRS